MGRETEAAGVVTGAGVTAVSSLDRTACAAGVFCGTCACCGGVTGCGADALLPEWGAAGRSAAATVGRETEAAGVVTGAGVTAVSSLDRTACAAGVFCGTCACCGGVTGCGADALLPDWGAAGMSAAATAGRETEAAGVVTGAGGTAVSALDRTACAAGVFCGTCACCGGVTGCGADALLPDWGAAGRSAAATVGWETGAAGVVTGAGGTAVSSLDRTACAAGVFCGTGACCGGVTGYGADTLLPDWGAAGRSAAATAGRETGAAGVVTGAGITAVSAFGCTACVADVFCGTDAYCGGVTGYGADALLPDRGTGDTVTAAVGWETKVAGVVTGAEKAIDARRMLRGTCTLSTSDAVGVVSDCWKRRVASREGIPDGLADCGLVASVWGFTGKGIADGDRKEVSNVIASIIVSLPYYEIFQFAFCAGFFLFEDIGKPHGAVLFDLCPVFGRHGEAPMRLSFSLLAFAELGFRLAHVVGLEHTLLVDTSDALLNEIELVAGDGASHDGAVNTVASVFFRRLVLLQLMLTSLQRVAGGCHDLPCGGQFADGSIFTHFADPKKALKRISHFPSNPFVAIRDSSSRCLVRTCFS